MDGTQNDVSRRHSWLWLTGLPGFGNRWMRRWLQTNPDPQSLLDATDARLTAAAAPKDWLTTRADSRGDSAFQSRLRWSGSHCEQLDIALLEPGHPHYPALLQETDDAPLLLFARGDTALLNRPVFAIVGSRAAKQAACRHSHWFAASLAEAGFLICSGMAGGVDAAAHRGALVKGSTVAVLGTGPDRVYPRSNQQLFEHILDGGVVLTEYPPGTGPRRHHFPRRNRIISGMSLGVLVVEAAEKSGSLITARLAIEQNREVFALPGSVDNPGCRGSNRLIGQGAQLAQSPADIIETLCGWTRSLTAEPQPSVPPLEREEALVYEALSDAPRSTDSLLVSVDLPPDRLSALLVQLELRGLVERFGGNWLRC